MQIGSFIKVFIIPEFKALTSNKWKLLLLLLIVITSFWGIGFSGAIQVYLKKKMDNPFVKFITLTIPREANYIELLKDLNKTELQRKYQFKEITEIHDYYPDFVSTSDKPISAYVREVNKKDALYNFIFSESDIVFSSSPIDITENETSWGVVVTEDFLKQLGYKDMNVGYINYIKAFGDSDQIVPLPVAAVVNQLPGYFKMLVSDKLLLSMIGGFNDNPLDLSLHKSELCFFIPTEESKEEILVKLNNLLPNQTFENLPNECLLNGFRFLLQTATPENDFTKIQQKFSSGIRTYNLTDKPLPPISFGNPGYISIPFNSLDSITVFQKYIEENHNHVRIDMNTVEAKNNFNFFDKISNLLSVLLTVFGSILMIAITLNTVLNHIDQNKTNLGTLKAFGMSNWSVTLVYTSISAMLILIISSLGYLISVLSGSLISHAVAGLKGMSVETGTDLFILQLDGFLIFTFLILPVLTVSVFIYFKLFNKTPGDLIYERD